MVLHGVGHVFWNECDCHGVIRTFLAAHDYLLGSTSALAALKPRL
jgi:hypothetical protein